MFKLYKVTNTITLKSYVGVTKRSVEDRWKQHLKEAKCNKYNIYFHDSIRKHGAKIFSVECIFECETEKEAFAKEIEFITFYNSLAPNGYNSVAGGIGVLNPSKQTRERMRYAKLGKYKGKNSPSAKTFLIQSPTGIQFIVKGGINKFCNKHKIYHQALLKSFLLDRPITRGASKGWKMLSKSQPKGEIMKKNYTHLILVLDESGSMAERTNATIEGVNSLLAEQKALPGDFTTALYKFSSIVKEVTAFEKLTKFNYFPNGSTALYDAIGRAITSEGVLLAGMDESKRPDRVVVVIVTDGEENNSTQYLLSDVKRLVTQQQTMYNWQFVFLGANIDAFSVGQSFGFKGLCTSQWDSSSDGGVRAMYSFTSSALRSYRDGTTNDVDLQAHNTTAVAPNSH